MDLDEFIDQAFEPLTIDRVEHYIEVIHEKDRLVGERIEEVAREFERQIYMGISEWVCEDCMEGDHEVCRRQGGWPFQETDERCGCHLSRHALDKRRL